MSQIILEQSVFSLAVRQLNGVSSYQYASVQVSILQVHPYLDDTYVGPRTLDVTGGVGATGGRSAVRFCGSGRR